MSYFSHILTMEAGSSPFKCCNLSWLRKLLRLLSLLATADRMRVYKLSPSLRISRSTRGKTTVWSCSVVFTTLVVHTPFSPLVNAAARKMPGDNFVLSKIPRPF